MARQPEPLDDDDAMQAAVTTLEQSGNALLPGNVVINERTIFGDIITAQPIKVPRNEPAVLRRVDAMAQAAATSWYYRFPVRNRKTNKIDYIEGPTIECADAVARYYGNNQVQTALAAETHTQWIFASRFVDLETGYSLIRPFLQPKRSTMGGMDDERRLQIAFGIGVSKCQRNVVDHALSDIMERAFKAAKKSLVDNIGKRLPEARDRILEHLRSIGGEPMIERVEQLYQRKQADWLAPDIARLFAECKAVEDGMALPDEVWPLPVPPEPTRGEATDVRPDAGGDPSGSANGQHGTAVVPPQPSNESAPPASPSPPPASASPPVKVWRIATDLVGQDAIYKALCDLVDMAESDDDLEQIRQQNHDRIAKFGQQRRGELINRMSARSVELEHGVTS